LYTLVVLPDLCCLGGGWATAARLFPRLFRRADAAVHANYFNQAGHRVTWQKLGEDFKDHQFCFQVLDEAQPNGRQWRDILNGLLEAGACPSGV